MAEWTLHCNFGASTIGILAALFQVRIVAFHS